MPAPAQRRRRRSPPPPHHTQPIRGLADQARMSSPISVHRSSREHHVDDSPGPTVAPGGGPARPREPDYSRVPWPATRMDVAGLGAVAVESQMFVAPNRRVAAKLNDLRDAFSGPYRAEGQNILVRPQFRMKGGLNDKNAKEHSAELSKLSPHAFAAGNGCSKPEDVTKMTQALIDAGKLPPGPPSTLPDRIREMQWEYGIGVDCAAYTRAAFESIHGAGKHGLEPLGTEGFRGLASNRNFKKIDLAGVKAGDVMTLSAPAGDAGHNVIVRDRRELDGPGRAAALAQLPRHGQSAMAFLSEPGPIHLFEVDSSWSAGLHGDSAGGYRSDVWLYNASTKTWGYVNKHDDPPTFHTSTRGPAEEPASAWRPR